jgi:choline dehydrogenase
MKIRDNRQFDVVIIGAGSAGSIMANRLSACGTLQVLLLEAGSDYPDPDQIPVTLGQGHSPVTAGFNWPLRALRRDERASATSPSQEGAIAILAMAAQGLPAFAGTAAVPVDPHNTLAYPLGKVVGGSSAVNGALALHGRKEDFDDWEALGNDFWRWSDVAPDILALSATSATTGGLPIEVPQASDYTRLQQAFAEACGDSGVVGAQEGARLCAIPKNTRDGQRVPVSALYLDPVRRRDNLTIWAGCHVDRLIMGLGPSGAVAEAVEFFYGGRRFRVNAGHVVLAAGAVHSPAVLLRSGIGPAAQLQGLNIAPVLDCPGIGRNLVDHPVVSIWSTTSPDWYTPGEAIHQLMLEQPRTQGNPCGLQMLMLSAVPTAMFPPLDKLVGAATASGISVVLPKPRSVGYVELLSRHALQPPRISVNCLAEQSDQRRMMDGVRLAWKILQSKPLRAAGLAPELWTQEMIDSDDLLGNMVQRTVRAAWHPVGTLKMGPMSDPMAVVDQFGALRGCANVSVADASVMPVIPSVPTNLTCMLVAERLARVLLRRLSDKDGVARVA